MKLLKRHWLFVLIIAVHAGCGHSAKQDESEDDIKARTPVTVTSIMKEDISSSISMNASSSFLKKSTLKSPASGYIRELKVSLGEHVRSGQPLFTLQTKEAAAYKDIFLKDTTLNYSGMIHVNANENGVVNNLPHIIGDYIQEGDELCSIAEQNSLVFLLEVPYELHQYINLNEHCSINLPDGKTIDGKIESKLSDMDISSQTQRFVIRPASFENIPANLLASISIVKEKKEKAITLPKDAVLANETQTEYWVMKLTNDSTAVKIPVKIGIQSRERIEITDPVFNGAERFVASGSYGLPDTASISLKSLK